MLLYHPAEDSNHCCYRILRLLSAVKADFIPMASLMICDFYSLFPGQLKYINGWPRLNSSNWRTLQEIPDEYEEMINARRVFFQLNSLQSAAVSHLHAKGLLEYSDESDKKIRLNKDLLPKDVIDTLRGDEVFKEKWFDIIANDLSKIELGGKRGLKSKTGLMEFIYD